MVGCILEFVLFRLRNAQFINLCHSLLFVHEIFASSICSIVNNFESSNTQKNSQKYVYYRHYWSLMFRQDSIEFKLEKTLRKFMRVPNDEKSDFLLKIIDNKNKNAREIIQNFLLK